MIIAVLKRIQKRKEYSICFCIFNSRIARSNWYECLVCGTHAALVEAVRGAVVLVVVDTDVVDEVLVADEVLDVDVVVVVVEVVVEDVLVEVVVDVIVVVMVEVVDEVVVVVEVFVVMEVVDDDELEELDVLDVELVVVVIHGIRDEITVNVTQYSNDWTCSLITNDISFVSLDCWCKRITHSVYATAQSCCGPT